MKKGGTNITSNIVLKYLEIWPDMPALTLAKKIYSENQEAFTDVEHARTIIRRYFGQSGARARGEFMRSQRNSHFREARDPGSYGIPESDSIKWSPVHINEQHNDILNFSDVHIPYHDTEALNAMIAYTKSHRNINTIVMNGDIIDVYQCSRFNKDPRKRSVGNEIWLLVEFINILQHEFPGVHIYYKLGNHEERLENYLMLKAPELLDIAEYKLSELLKIRGIEGVTYIERQIMYAGKLPIVHGHEFISSAFSPVNPARGLYLRAASSAMTSHHHRTSSHSDTDINEKLRSTWSLGCLCDLHPEYALINKWNHGFAFIKTEGREYEVDNYKIYKGQVYRD